METVTDFLFLGSKITADGDCSHEIKRCLLLGRKAMTNLDSILKSTHYFADKDPSSQTYGFSSSHVWMWGLDHKESWTPKNWCFWTVVLEKILESPLDCKEIQPVHPKGNQSWIFIGKTDAEAETLATWCEELTQKRPWCWERLKAGGEGDDRRWDGWMASLIEWTWVWTSSRSWWKTRKPGMLQFQGGRKESDMTERLNWTEPKPHSPGHRGRAQDPELRGWCGPPQPSHGTMRQQPHKQGSLALTSLFTKRHFSSRSASLAPEKNHRAWKHSTHGHYQVGNIKIRLIMFFAAKDREALYSQQK